MRYPFQKPSLAVIVEDLTTLADELKALNVRHTTNAELIHVQADNLRAEAEALQIEALRASRIAGKVADLLA